MPSALVIGSMVPDAAHFVPTGLTGTDTHRLHALAWFCVPVGLLAFLVYHALLRGPCRELMPSAVRLRLGRREATHPRARMIALPAVVLSLTIGSLTHVAWDAFTHQTGAAVRAWPALRVTLFVVGPHSIRLYKVLQHGSTLLGLAMLVCWTLLWLRRRPAHEEQAASSLTPATRGVLVAVLILIPLATGLAAAALKAPADLSLAALQSFAGHAAVSGTRAFLIASMVLGLIWRLVERRDGSGGNPLDC